MGNFNDWIFDRVHHYYLGRQYANPSEILSETPDVQYLLLEQSRVPEDLLVELAKSTDSQVLDGVLNNLSITPAIIDYIADNADLDEVVNFEWPERTIRYEIASHTDSSGYALDKISDTDDEVIRGEIASHPNALPETLDYLADFDDEYSNQYTKFYIIDNPNTSIETLQKLADDLDEDVCDYAINELNSRGIEI